MAIRATRYFDPGRKLSGMSRQLEKPTDALKQVGVIVTASSRQAFRDQSFDGQKWRDRAVPNIFGALEDFDTGRASPKPRRFDARPALVDTGTLRRSIAHRIVDKRTVEIGTTLDYAQTHNAGEESESVTITESIQKKLAKWLRGAGQEWRGKMGFLLGERYTGERLKMRVPERRFIGITKQAQKAVIRAVGVAITEAR